MLLIYSLFVGITFSRLRLAANIQRIRLNPAIKFVMLVIVAGMMAEFLAWSSSYLERNPNPALFHPQLVYDLLIGIGFYAGNGIAWALILSRYRFSLAQVFATQGVFGVFIEQNGAVFRQGLAAFPLGMIFWVYVFLVYGSFIAMAYAITQGELNQAVQRSGWLKYPLALALVWLLTFGVTWLWVLPWEAGGLIPGPKPIWEQPLW